MPIPNRPSLTFGPFQLDLRGRSLTRNDVPVPVGERALDVLAVLAAADGQLVGKDALLDQVWARERGTAEQPIKEGKNAITWTRLSCMRFAANVVRLQLHVLAYNLANFLRTLALPAEVKHWSLTTLRDRLVKIGGKIVRHGRSITFQMAEVMVPRALFR